MSIERSVRKLNLSHWHMPSICNKYDVLELTCMWLRAGLNGNVVLPHFYDEGINIVVMQRLFDEIHRTQLIGQANYFKEIITNWTIKIVVTFAPSLCCHNCCHKTCYIPKWFVAFIITVPGSNWF